MDVLNEAVVDVTTLVSVSQALAVVELDDGMHGLGADELRRLRAEIVRGARAYLDRLGRPKDGLVDATLLTRCRAAAEAKMPGALARGASLQSLVRGTAGALDGMAAARQDLWRLAHLNAQVRAAVGGNDESSPGKAQRIVRRCLRRALIGYAEALLRAAQRPKLRLKKARAKALAAIDARGVAEAQAWAARSPAAGGRALSVGQAVAKSLQHLVDDWRTEA